MGDLHLVLPALNLSTLNAGISIMMQQEDWVLGLGAKGLGPGLDKRQSSLHDDSLPLPVEQSTTQRKVQVQESRGQKLMHLIAEFADQ